MAVIAALLVVLTPVVLCVSPPSYFSADNAKSLGGSASSFLSSVASLRAGDEGDMGALSAAARVLSSLGLPFPSGFCKDLKKIVPGEFAPAHSALAIAASAGSCGSVSVSDSVLSSGLEADAVSVVSAAVLGMDATGKLGEGKKSKKMAVKAAKALLAFADEDGTFKAHKDDEFGSVASAGVVFPALAAALEAAGPKGGKSAIGQYGQALEDLFGLVETLPGDMLSFYDPDTPSVDPLLTTGGILGGVNAVAAAAGRALPLSKSDLAGFASYILSRKEADTPVLGNALLSGLAFVEDNTVGNPLVISVVRASVPLSARGQDGTIVVAVTDVRGKAVEGTKVVVDSASPLGSPGSTLFANKAMEGVAGSPGQYGFPLFSAKPSPGYYRLSISASAGDSVLPASAVVDAKVVTPISLKSCTVSVVQDSVGGSEKVKYPCKPGAALKDTIVADSSQELDIAFSIRSSVTKKGVSPHQVFLRFVHVDSGIDTHFVIPVADAATGAHKISLAFGAAAPEFGELSGKYLAQIVIGDAFVESATVWDLGTLELEFVGSTAAADLAAASAAGTSKPDIAHMFRTPEKTAPAIISLAFAAAAAAPVVVLMGLLAKLGANMANFPTSQPLMLYAVGFHVSIAGIALLYLTYFLHLNMFQTLGYLIPISAVTAFTGKALLSNHIAFRLSGNKPHSE